MWVRPCSFPLEAVPAAGYPLHVTTLTNFQPSVTPDDLLCLAAALRDAQYARAHLLLEPLADPSARIARANGALLTGPDLAEFRDAAQDALLRLRAEDYAEAKWQVLMLGDLAGILLDDAMGVTRF